MNEGTIGLDKSRRFIGWCIKVVTGMPWAHAKTYLNGLTWESTVWWVGYWWKTGIKVTVGYAKADEYWQLKLPMTEEQIRQELYYWIDKLNRRRPYNVPKLLSLVIVYPLRRFFNRIGWIPFDNPIWGEECSSSVDEAKKFWGCDLLPKQHEGYTAPGDIRKSKLLERREA